MGSFPALASPRPAATRSPSLRPGPGLSRVSSNAPIKTRGQVACPLFSDEKWVESARQDSSARDGGCKGGSDVAVKVQGGANPVQTPDLRRELRGPEARPAPPSRRVGRHEPVRRAGGDAGAFPPARRAPIRWTRLASAAAGDAGLPATAPPGEGSGRGRSARWPGGCARRTSRSATCGVDRRSVSHRQEWRLDISIKWRLWDRKSVTETRLSCS